MGTYKHLHYTNVSSNIPAHDSPYVKDAFYGIKANQIEGQPNYWDITAPKPEKYPQCSGQPGYYRLFGKDDGWYSTLSQFPWRNTWMNYRWTYKTNGPWYKYDGKSFGVLWEKIMKTILKNILKNTLKQFLNENKSWQIIKLFDFSFHVLVKN